MAEKKWNLGLLMVLGVGLMVGMSGSFPPATAPEARQLAYKAYANNQPSLWPLALGTLRRIGPDARPMNPELTYEWCLAEYGYLAYCIGTKNTSVNVEERLEALEEVLDKMLDLRPNQPAFESMMGSVIAMQISFSPASAIFLGPRSSSYLGDAMAHGPQSPEAWVENGNMRHHAPALFGGNMTEAVKCFRKAADLFAANPGRAKDNWLRLHALAWLGKSYESLGQYSQAKAAYREALAVEPNFHWVKQELLPALERRG